MRGIATNTGNHFQTRHNELILIPMRNSTLPSAPAAADILPLLIRITMQFYASAGGSFPDMSSIQNIPVKTIDGKSTSLQDFAGSVLLVVNVASKCGLTPQYEALEKIYEEKKDKGFAVLGFPANNFGAQEPGTNQEIAEFCSLTYSVKFPMFEKISVVGDDQHPLYKELTGAAPRAQGDPDAFRDRLKGFGMTPNQDPDVLWNFEKFLIGKNGEVVARFAPTVTPDDPAVVAAIDAELAK
jgi:glutathione peroxidase